CATEGVEPARGSDVVHDLAGGVSDPAAALQRAARDRGGDRRRQPQLSGNGKPDRVLCEPVGAAHGPEWRADVCGVVATGEGSMSGSVRASGRAVREAGGRVAAGAGSESLGVVPGEAGVAERAAGEFAVGRVAVRASGSGRSNGEVRPDADAGGRQRVERSAGVQYGSV